MSFGGPTFRIADKGIPASSTHTVMPPSYPCQAPGCRATSATIACPEHLAMLPIEVQGALTNALATGESGLYGSAMATAMRIWVQVSEK